MNNDIANEDGVSVIDTRTAAQKQLDDVIGIVKETAHLSARETGKAVVEYMNK